METTVNTLSKNRGTASQPDVSDRLHAARIFYWHGMRGVGPSLGPQLMAEIGEVSRFSHKGTLTTFIIVDPGANQSGIYEQQSVRTSKLGSARLGKTLFQVIDVLIKTSLTDYPVYTFMSEKRAEGKLYYVYMTADLLTFLFLN